MADRGGMPVHIKTPYALTVGDLEDLAYRLRLQGATDDTEVRLGYGYAESRIPFPVMELEPTPTPPAPEPRPQLLTSRALRLAVILLALVAGYLVIGLALL